MGSIRDLFGLLFECSSVGEGGVTVGYRGGRGDGGREWGYRG